SIEDEIRSDARELKLQQEKFESDKQVIESSVELENAKHDLNLTVDPYIRLLEFELVENIKQQIEKHAQEEANKRLEEQRKKQAIDKEIEKMKETELAKDETKDVTHVPPIDDLPFGDIEKTEHYSIKATDEQHKLIQQYLNENDIDWSIEMELPF